MASSSLTSRNHEASSLQTSCSGVLDDGAHRVPKFPIGSGGTLPSSIPILHQQEARIVDANGNEVKLRSVKSISFSKR
jgi:hypothetical protein